MNKRIVVVKFGSTVVTNKYGMDAVKVRAYCKGISRLQQKYQVVIVSSGSVATGRAIWEKHNKHRHKKDVDAQSLAMLGSGPAFVAWQDGLHEQGLAAAQLLITHKELEDSDEGGILIDALRNNIKHGIITVANENDALSVYELALLGYGGENDGLASHIACQLNAEALLLLNNMGGLFDDHNKEINIVKAGEWRKVAAMASRRRDKSSMGTGGLTVKVNAAIQAADRGVMAFIASANSNYIDIINNKVGTCFVAKEAILR